MPYKYRLTITKDDNITEQYVNNKTELCAILNVSMSALGNILLGRVKNKYNFLKIERVFIPPKTKKNEKEYKKFAQREATRKCLRKKKLKECINKQEELQLEILNNMEKHNL